MLAQFYWNPVLTGSDEDGIPSYEDRIFVKITRDVTHTVNREAEDEDFERFPGELAFFKKATAKYEPIEGQLPLEFWPLASPADVQNLKGHGIRTVQELVKYNSAKMPRALSELRLFGESYMKIAGDVAKASEMITDLTAQVKRLQEDRDEARREANTLRQMMSKESAA